MRHFRWGAPRRRQGWVGFPMTEEGLADLSLSLHASLRLRVQTLRWLFKASAEELLSSFEQRGIVSPAFIATLLGTRLPAHAGY